MRRLFSRTKVLSAATDTAERYFVPALLILVVVQLLLRIHGLYDRGITRDEFVACFPLRNPSFWDFLNIIRVNEPDHPQLDDILRYAWTCILGSPLTTARTLGIFLSCFTAPLLALIGRRLCNARAGLLIAGLYAISPAYILQAQIARCYIQLIFFFACSLYTLLVAIDSRSSRWWALHAASNVLLLGTHLFALACVAPMWMFNAIFQRSRMRWLNVGAQVTYCLVYYGYLYLTLPRIPHDLGGMPSLLELPLILTAFDLAILNCGRLRVASLSNFLREPNDGFLLTVSIYLFILLYGGAFLLFLFNIGRNGRRLLKSQLDDLSRKQWYGRVVVLVCCLTPLVGVCTLCILWRPCFQSRYVVPFLGILMFLSLSILVSNIRVKLFRYVIVALALLLYSYQLYLFYPGRDGTGHIGVARLIQARGRPEDVIVVRSVLFTRTFLMRRNMDGWPQPVIPAYTYNDMLRIAYDYLSRNPGKAADGSDRSVWALTYPSDFVNDLQSDQFEKAMSDCGFTWNTVELPARIPIQVYQIRIADSGLIPKSSFDDLLPNPLNPEHLMQKLSIPADDPRCTRVVSGLRRVATFWYEESDLVLSCLVCMPAIERSAYTAAEWLARWIIAQNPESKYGRLALGMVLCEKGDWREGQAMLESAVTFNQGMMNRFAAFIEEPIRSIYLEKDLNKAQRQIRHLAEVGVFCPELLLTRAGLAQAYPWEPAL